MAVLSRLRSRRYIEQPISGAEQLAEEIGLPLLLEAPRGALAWGGEEGLPAPSLKRAQLETARSLIDRLPSLTDGEPPGSVFVSEGIEADDGVSPALALATVSALDGRRTLLAEVDFRHRRMSRELKLPAGPGIGDYLNRAAHPQALLQPLQLEGRAAGDGADAGSLVFIAAGEGSPDPMPPPIWDRFRHFVSKVTRAYDFVVLSGEPVLAPSQPGQLTPLVEATVVCARPAAISMEQARLAAAALHRWFPRTVGLVAASD
jgi:Mrp family chromosome partitioning ATPase